MKITRKKKNRLILVLFTVPAVLLYFTLFLFPIFSSLYYSLYDFNLLKNKMTFIWLNNYIELFTNTRLFTTALTNNIKFTVFVLVFQVLFSFSLALLLFSKIKGSNFFKALFFYPVVLSSVAITFIWIFLCDSNYGTINSILKVLGLGILQQDWLGDPKISLYVVALCYIWQHVGFHMVIFLAGLQNIPVDMYEVAKMEGARFFQQLRFVTLPMIMPAATISIVLTTVGSFKLFDLIYLMTGGGPYQTTEVLAKVIYTYAFEYQRVGFGSAVSVVLLLVTSSIGFIQLIYFRKMENKNH